jgi:hypothetical protein
MQIVPAILVSLVLEALASPQAAVNPVRLETGQDPVELSQPWMDRAPVWKSRYYDIKSDLPKDELRDYAAHLDATFEAYRKRLSSLRQNLPASFNVMLFAKRSDYETTLRYNFSINATGTGGMFFHNPRGSALAIWTEGLPRPRVHHVIQHEGFHQVAFALFQDNLPPWVNEGLAEFFGEGVMVDGQLIIGQTNPRIIAAIKEAIETKAYIPFLQMLTMDGTAWNANVSNGSAKMQYEQAWSMVHFLVYGEGGKYAEEFSDFLRYLNVGMVQYDAFVRAFGTDNIVGFERRWIEFAQNARPSSFTTAMERAEFLAAGLKALSVRGVYPTTLDELRDQLRLIQFTYTLSEHGVETQLSAADDAMFNIPPDDLLKEGDAPPHFMLSETETRGMSYRERQLNLEYPVPPTLETEGLRPHNLEVQWIRDLEKNEFVFEVVVKKKD